MNAEEVRKLGEESYDKWFERWFEKQRVLEKIKQSSMKGYSSYTYLIDKGRSDYERRRMYTQRFVDKLAEKLDGFEIKLIKSRRYETYLFGKVSGYRWTDPEVVISWMETK